MINSQKLYNRLCRAMSYATQEASSQKMVVNCAFGGTRNTQFWEIYAPGRYRYLPVLQATGNLTKYALTENTGIHESFLQIVLKTT